MEDIDKWEDFDFVGNTMPDEPKEEAVSCERCHRTEGGEWVEQAAEYMCDECQADLEHFCHMENCPGQFWASCNDDDNNAEWELIWRDSVEPVEIRTCYDCGEANVVRRAQKKPSNFNKKKFALSDFTVDLDKSNSSEKDSAPQPSSPFLDGLIDMQNKILWAELRGKE